MSLLDKAPIDVTQVLLRVLSGEACLNLVLFPSFGNTYPLFRAARTLAALGGERSVREPGEEP